MIGTALRAVAPLCVMITCSTCAIGYRAVYTVSSVGITRMPPLAEGVYSPSVAQLELSEIPVLRIEDDRAIFEWNISPSSLNVRITNKASPRTPSSGSLFVLIDSAEFVDSDGGTHDVVPFPWKKTPPEISPGKRRVYLMFPADYGKERRALFGGIPPYQSAESPEGIRELYKEHVGKSFKIRLPIRVGELVQTYEFAMTVSGVHPYFVREYF